MKDPPETYNGGPPVEALSGRNREATVGDLAFSGSQTSGGPTMDTLTGEEPEGAN